jgi:hypothetical protein
MESSSRLLLNKSMNRKLKEDDTFLKVFPNYRICKDDYKSPTRFHYQYNSVDDEGKPTCIIDRTHTKKLDFIKVYTEEILKIASMRRANKR